MPRTPDSSPQTLRVFASLMADPAQWRYGYDLSRETGLASGSLYPILMRLTGRELLETRWEPSEQPGRPPRHLYRLTAAGAALATERLAAQVKVTRRQRIGGAATENLMGGWA
jgi:DNA-binding PadR family transcriptional regulator